MDRWVTKKRLFVTALLLPVVLLLVLYLAWPIWVTPLARGVLADADVELLHVEIHRPGWQGLGISDLKLRYPAAGYDSTLTIPEVLLSYSWRTLLQGQLETLQISAMRLQIELLGDDVPADENESVSEEPLLVAEFLPKSLFSQLPFSQFHVDSLQLEFPATVGYQDLMGSLHYSAQQLQLNLSSPEKSDADLSVFELNVEVDQQNRVQLGLLKNTQPILVIDSKITADTTQLEGELKLDLLAATGLLQELKLVSPDYQLEGEAQLHWLLPVPEVIADDWAVTAHFQTQLAVEQFKQPALSVEALAFSSIGQIHFSPDTIRLHVDADSSIRADKVKAQDLQMDSLALKMPRAFDVILEQQQLAVPELEFQLGPTPLSWQAEDYNVAAAHVQLKGVLLALQNPAQLSSHIDVSLTGVETPAGDLNLKPLDLQGSWQLENEILNGTVQLSYAAGLILVNGDMIHNLSSGLGHFNSQLQRLNFQQTQSYLPRLFENWSYPFDLFAGQVDMNMRLNWDAEQVYAKGRLTLTDVSGFYDTNLFRGLNSELLIDGPVDNLKLAAKRFKVANVDAGVLIKNITFSLQSTAGRLQIKDFKAELLGGQVGQRLVSYDWAQDKNDLLLQIQGIQLAELLNLETGIEGLGVLDGQLPISISSTGISTQQSEIKARSPGGFIKYQGAKSMSSAVADVGVGFALEALENFHYDVLDVKASYSEDGQLKLQTVLLGRNPDMSERRPVRYNINIQENIPALIQSLKLTQQISDDIERRIQTFYKQK
jgi:Dicarboxylate transport